MAIIYSYPVITPTVDDLLLGTDQGGDGKPTKNFTVQSIVDLLQSGATGLGAVIEINSSAKSAAGSNQSAIDFLNISGTGTVTFNSFSDGIMSVSGGVGTNFVSIASTDFTGNLTGVVKAGSSIQGDVTGVTQPVGTSNTKLATTEFVMSKVDPSILTFIGTSGGNQTVNLAAQTFSILGTANQIESVGTAQKITFRFPTAGVTLPDGSVATTQAATDDSTKIATTAFVRDYDDTQDLDFIGDTGSSSVLLNSQILDFEGTTNQVVTAVTSQKVKFSLPSSVTISGTYTGATFAGDLLGTVNTATTGVTQSAGDDSTKIATTAYVDNAASSKTLEYAGDATGPFALNLTNDDLEFNGDSNITITAAAVTGNKGIVTVDLNDSVTITGTSKADTFTTTAGTATWVTTVLDGFTSITSTAFTGDLTGNASTATALASSGAIAITGDTTSTGGPYTYTSGGAISIATTIADTTVTAKVLTNLATPTSSAIAATDTILAAMAKLQGQITGLAGSLAFEGTWDASTGNPPSATPLNGQFWIVSVAGSTNLDGITDWLVGDWAIYVNNGAGTDAWQKLDQSNEVLGSGAANKIAKWTSTNTLATGLIDDDGTNVTVGNSGNLIVEGNTTLGNADTDSTTVKGPAVFEETLRINEGISLGAATYGTAGQVLTSGGGSASVNTWTTPTTGTVTSVSLTETGDALAITGSPVTSSGTINIAGAGASTDYINGELNLVAFPTLDNYQYWTLSDGTNTTNITTTGTATFTGASGITVAENAGTITITGSAQPGTGTQYTLPVWSTTTSLGDSMVSQNAGGTELTVSGNVGIVLTDTDSVKLGVTGNSGLPATSGTTQTGLLRLKASNNATLDMGADHINAVGWLQVTDVADLSLEYNLLLQPNGGNVGIGTNSPNEKLHVDGGTTNVVANFESTDAKAYISFKDNSTTNTDTVFLGAEGNDMTFYAGSASTKRLTINSSGNSTFSGTIASNNIAVTNSGNGEVSVTRTSGATIKNIAQSARGQIGTSSNHELQLITNATSRLTIDTAGDSTFTGNVEIDGNLTVDGDIIHGGGNSGTFTGSKSFTGGAASVILFRLFRPTTGTLVFDVYLTSGTSGYACKKYTVAHRFNTAPNYNKIIDSGAATNGDYVVTFANNGQSVGGDSISCSIAATTTQDIYYTIQVGQGATAVTRYTS